MQSLYSTTYNHTTYNSNILLLVNRYVLLHYYNSSGVKGKDMQMVWCSAYKWCVYSEWIIKFEYISSVMLALYMVFF